MSALRRVCHYYQQHREYCLGDAVTGYTPVDDGQVYDWLLEEYFINSTDSIA